MSETYIAAVGLSIIKSTKYIRESTTVHDPLSEIITMLRPRAVISKPISGAGKWGVRYTEFGHPSFCTVLEGSCRLVVDGHPTITLRKDDFVLLPATPGFTMSGSESVTPVHIDPKNTVTTTSEVRHGDKRGRPEMRMLGGHFLFDSPDASMLAAMLPAVVHVRQSERLVALVRMVGEECREVKPGRDLALARLVELLLVESLRATSGKDAPPGLLRGLTDARLAPAIRAMHRHVARAWTVPQLAKLASLSRSAFFGRFLHTVGMAPMEYLTGWRMSVAKDLLRHHDLCLGQVAERVGYGSGSSFSTAFSRHVGQPPRTFARQQRLTQTLERR